MPHSFYPAETIWDNIPMKNELSGHYSVSRLLKFALPSIAMMLFTSTYSMFDGFFVSNWAGSDALAAVNIIWPLIMIFGAPGFILGIGGTALVSATMGEGDVKRARGLFSMLFAMGALAGLVLCIIGLLVQKPIAELMGAEGELLQLCLDYGTILMSFNVFFMLQNLAGPFYIAAGHPKIGLLASVVSGITNIGLDALFIIGLDMGVAGAAWGTGISALVGGIIPLAFFARRKNNILHFVRPLMDWRALGKSCVNGLSEFVGTISMSIVIILYNYQLMIYYGADGVAAYSAIDYINFLFIAVFLGYGMGTEPIVSYNFGADNRDELKSLFKKSLCIIGVCSIIMVVTAQLTAPLLTGIYVGYNAELEALTLHGFRIFALSFALCGLGIYGSGFFTALNNGVVSAVISFLRTMVFEAGAIMLLPLAFGAEGIWWAIVVAEVMAALLTVGCLWKFKDRYGYW